MHPAHPYYPYYEGILPPATLLLQRVAKHSEHIRKFVVVTVNGDSLFRGVKISQHKFEKFRCAE